MGGAERESTGVHTYEDGERERERERGTSLDGLVKLKYKTCEYC